MDIDKLIKRIKCPQIQSCPMDGEYPSCKACQKSIQQEVVTAISASQAETEKLRAELDHLKAEWDKYQPREHWDMLNELCKNLHDELEQVKLERDAAVSDMETIMAYGGGNLDTCQYCKNGQCYARGGTKLCLPEWRGRKEG